MTTLQGLSENEAQQRRQRGQGNDIDLSTSRSYTQIVYHNVFTFVNIALLVIGAMLIALGLPQDAITTAGLVLINIVVGLTQEFRAKRKLDQIALLTRPEVTVIREGQERTIDPTEIVLGDLVVLNAGDQLVCDGVLLEGGEVEVDESLITGESDFIHKQPGDEVYSGSICVSGSAFYEATKVGAESFANRITAKARRFDLVTTPLQQDVNRVVRFVGLTSVIFGASLYIGYLRMEIPLESRVQMAAVVVGMIPQGLIFLVTLAYGLGAVRMAGKGALIQRINAIESMSNIDVLCLDKTGTLTTNEITFNALHPCDGTSEDDMARLLGIYTASTGSGSRTSDAVRTVFAGEAQVVQQEIPFSSARKWSAAAFDTDAVKGVYVLGAPQILAPHLGQNDLDSLRGELSAQGLRTVMFAHSPDVVNLRNGDEEPQLPDNLIPLGLVSLSDTLRPDAHETMRRFTEVGIQLKIISGDDPDTVAALARQAGFDAGGGIVSGVELATMNSAAFTQSVLESHIFGRINPDQKERILETLQAQGHYAAMIGDGVNDVPSLKRAKIGIAMQSGSTATRNSADIILMGDSFSVLPAVFEEGQCIVNGVFDNTRLLLSRTFYVALMIITTSLMGTEFFFLPRHDVLLSFLSAGLPLMLLTIWAKPGQTQGSLLNAAMRFVIPAALSIGLMGTGIYLYYVEKYDANGDIEIARTALTLTTLLCGISLILFVKPPRGFFVATDPLSGDWRPAAAAAGMVILTALIMLLPDLREFFAMIPLSAGEYARIGVVSVVWLLVFRYILKVKLFERFIGI